FMLNGIISISSGQFHSFALKNDGTVWAWGNNSYGQLGIGTTTGTSIPIQVNISNVIKIRAGDRHTLALKNDGTIWTWGSNSQGQLGDGSTTDRIIPGQVNTLTEITEITAGWSHSLVLKNDGTVWAWGFNGQGQLGDGTITDRWFPIEVTSLCTVAGLPEELSSTFNPLLTPTLNTGEFTITLPQSKREATVSIYNSLGEKVYGEVVSGTRKEISLKNIPAGIYFVRVGNGEKTVVKKMVVAR
ncbi:MAG: T9SS type A sorting domain-containing protein, partial [Bacteroidia bacterium]|nr:T9SS type A sorting domain-containing protein [Bacteroidia bacterium]